MPVGVLRVVLVFQPFLQLAVLADLVRRDARKFCGQLGGELLVGVENAGRSCRRWNRQRMIWWSIVGPMTSPPCSGELDGPLMSLPVSGSSTRKSAKNCAAPFMSG